jgi:hypothetical protein
LQTTARECHIVSERGVHMWAWDTIISHGGSAVRYYSISRCIAKSWIWVKYRKKSHHVVQMLFFHWTIWIWGIIFWRILPSGGSINGLYGFIPKVKEPTKLRINLLNNYISKCNVWFLIFIWVFYVFSLKYLSLLCIL